MLTFCGIVVLPLIWLVATQNRFVRLANLIRESWANVDVALKRRHDLIPNLVETVKGYAKHEQDTLVKIVAMRNEAMEAIGNICQAGPIEAKLGAVVHRLIAAVEDYPELKADQHFLELQRELASTEDRIAAARRFYNANVREFNTLRESFPSSLVGGGRTPAEYFEIDNHSERLPPNSGIFDT